MKAYVITTGAVFGLLTVAHLARMFMEAGFSADPAYWAITTAAAALCAWSVHVLRRAPR
ncbi:MAG: hypothetical protein ACJ8GN_04490 [Longimicrobiaceae bacterium]